jgi:carotenoid cleavage dioxygenase-like enzyme
LAKVDFGGFELPAFNHLHQGEETCFTYLAAFYHQQTIDEDYSWDFAKLDSCQQTISKTWHQPGYLPNEPHFVPNPQGETEDDGVLLTVAYDFRNEKSKLLIIDTKDMVTKQEFELPHIIPQYFHSNFWASE